MPSLNSSSENPRTFLGTYASCAGGMIKSCPAQATECPNFKCAHEEADTNNISFYCLPHMTQDDDMMIIFSDINVLVLLRHFEKITQRLRRGKHTFNFGVVESWATSGRPQVSMLSPTVIQ